MHTSRRGGPAQSGALESATAAQKGYGPGLGLAHASGITAGFALKKLAC